MDIVLHRDHDLNLVTTKFNGSFGRRLALKIVCLWLALFGATTWVVPSVEAHTEQQEPSHVLIYPRRDSLTLVVSGDRTDLTDVLSSSHETTASSSSMDTAQAQKVAAHYVETHLFFEQGEQVLPLKAFSLRTFDVQGLSEMNQRFEVLLCASRPLREATTPLTVASDLFNGLGNARTLVVLGNQEKSIQGKATVEFSQSATVATLSDNLRDFAWSGVLQAFQVGPLLLLATLFLGASLGSARWTASLLVAGALGASVTFLLDLSNVFHAPSSWSDGGLALCIALAGVVSWEATRHAELTSTRGWLLCALSFVGGLAVGTSFAAPLRIWGLPEQSLLGCGLAFVAALALVQTLMALVFWPTLMYWNRKFTHQSNYGGMSWPRAVQIASLCCAALGAFYGVQHLLG